MAKTTGPITITITDTRISLRAAHQRASALSPDSQVMIAWMLPPDVAARLAPLAVETDLHCTMAYLGRVADVGVDGLLKAHAAMSACAAAWRRQ